MAGRRSGASARRRAGRSPARGEIFAEHQFSSPRLLVTTSMHRRAGSQREWVQAVTDGGLYAVSDARNIVRVAVAAWSSARLPAGKPPLSSAALLMRHFDRMRANQTVPETAGEQALLAQRIVEKLWRDAISE